MAFSPAKPHHRHHFLRFLILLSLFFISHARLTLQLDRSYSKALSTILKDLGIIGQRFPATNPCSAAGVFCERRLTGNETYALKVTRLVFKSRTLHGSLSPAIGKLSELKELSVSHNSIVDQVPPEIIHCKKLEILDLKNNLFSGEIPSNLSTLIRLRVLDLSSNKFTGELSFLKYFPNLESLSLANNQFSGKIPSSIGSFRNLRSFDFWGNNFLEGNSAPLMNDLDESTYPKRYVFAEKKSTNGTRSSAAQAPSPNESKSAQGPSSSPGTINHKHKNKRKRAMEWILGFFVGSVGGGISGFISTLMFKLVLATISTCLKG